MKTNIKEILPPLPLRLSASRFSKEERDREREREREREQMKERRIYTLLGLFLLIAFIYLNYFSSSQSPPALKIPVPWLQPKLSFIGRNSTRFVDLSTGEAVYVNGWNSYWLLSAGSHSAVSEMLSRGRAMGMGVCRTWAFSDGGPTPLQISPGQFDEIMFQVFSFVPFLALIIIIIIVIFNFNIVVRR
jgi:hypothetical protein